MPISSQDFGDIGGAVSSIFGGIGELASAKGYKQAADIAHMNEGIAEQSTKIQEQQAGRKIYQALGGQRSDIAGAGLAASGSALDVIRSSAEQGSLTKQLIQNQGTITALGYEQESNSYSAMASAAKASGSGGILGGIVKGIGAVASIAGFFSDARLKTVPVLQYRRKDGLGIYHFSYRGSSEVFEGVMAEEVRDVYPTAVTTEDGFLKVNYALIGVEPKLVEQAVA